MASKKSLEQTAAVERLKKRLTPGDTIYLIMKHTSQTGMTHVITSLQFTTDGRDKAVIQHLSHDAAIATGMRHDPSRDGVKVSSGSIEPGAHLVACLGQSLFGDSNAFKMEWL
jgi:hypothetical protein